MNNKLVLDRGTKQYIWDKHEIDLIHNYFWNKYNVDIDYLYKWKQSYAVYSPQFYWDVYQLLNTIHFTWDTYELKEITGHLWNTYTVNETSTYNWTKYVTKQTTKYYWDRYTLSNAVHNWYKYEYKTLYNFYVKYALNSINRYLNLKYEYLTFYNINPDTNNGSTQYSDYHTISDNRMCPRIMSTLVDLDLSQFNSIVLCEEPRINAYPNVNMVNVVDIPTATWRYEVSKVNSSIYYPASYSSLVTAAENTPTKCCIFTRINDVEDKTCYYIMLGGLTKFTNNTLNNVVKVETMYNPDMYYTPEDRTAAHFIPPVVGFPTRAVSTTEKSDIDRYHVECWNKLSKDSSIGEYLTDLKLGENYDGILDEKLDMEDANYYPLGILPESHPWAGYVVERTEHQEVGKYIGYVTNSNINAYPKAGVQGSYYYVYKFSNGDKTFVNTIETTVPNAYEDNKYNTEDGYYYKFNKSVVEYEKTNQIADYVSSNNINDYPRDGVQDDYWYVLTDTITNQEKGTLTGEIFSVDSNTYPQDGVQDNVWYEYTGSSTTHEKGDPTGNSVESTDGTAHPESGPQNGVWYESTGNYTTQSKGSHIEQVSSTSKDTYPQDGIQGDYWYTYNREAEGYTKGEPTGTIVSSSDAAAYPNNGRLAADGFWYESIEPETSEKKGSLIGSISANSPDAYPQNGIKDNYWYVYDYEGEPTKVAGAFIEKVHSTSKNEYPANAISGDYWYIYQGEGILPFIITDSELYGGVKYKSYINTEADWRAGTVSSASIEFTTSVPMVLGDEIQYFKRYSRDNSWSYVDNYIVDEVIKTPYQDVYKVVAYDYITLFDVYVDEWLKTLTYPITIQNLYTQLVSHIQTTSGKDLSVLKTDIGTNGSIEVLHGFEGVNITGRQILQFIAEATGRCVGMRSTEANRYIDVQAWGDAGTFNSVPSNRVSLNMSEYEIAAPTKVVVRTTEDDVGGSAGSGTEGYDVVGNPLFYGVSQTTLNTAAAGILSEMTPTHNFHNGTIEMLQDYDIPINSWFRIYAADGTTDLGYFLAMGKEFDGKGVKYTCDGKATRDTQASNQNSEIIALLGKYNELKSSIDENSATIVDLTKGQSSITQRVDSISTSVSDLQGNQSSITQTVDSLNSKVTAQGNKVNSLESEINQTAEEISLKVSKNEIISAINLSTESIDISSDKINLTGYITASDLKTGGATTINGSNITTGTISADRINLTGAISWGDLDSNVQSEIQAGGGGGLNEDEVNTLITSKLVSSPTIAGGKFADLNKKNYLKMGSSSDNSVGYLNHYFTPYSTSEPVCVMGYQQGQLPNWTLAPYNIPILGFARQSSTAGTTALIGTWDFSGATVRGLNVSGDVNVVPVWG